MEAGLRWRRSPERNNSQLQLSLVDANAKEILHSLTSRFPQLENTVKLNPLEMDIHSADFYQLLNNFQEQGKGSFDHVYICVEDQTLSLHAALNLQKQLNYRETPLTVRMEEGGGLSRLFRGENQANGSYENIKIFDLLEQTCTCELLLKGTHEILARNLHAAYLEGLKKTHDLKGNQEAWVPWEELTLDIQEKNRRQADRIPLVLAAAGYRIDPLMDWDAESFRFSEEKRTARMILPGWHLWNMSSGVKA